jgi:hypothetical protein
MRIVFFILLKLAEIIGVILCAGIIAGLIALLIFLGEKIPNWVGAVIVAVIVIPILGLYLVGLVIANWETAGKCERWWRNRNK